MDYTHFSYKDIDGGVQLTSYNGRDALLEIPAELGGRPVISLGRCFAFLNTALTEVLIPDTVTEIGFGAFEGCAGLRRINLPQRLTTLGFRAFARCAGLEEITLPDGLTHLQEGTFNGCTALKTLRLPDSLRIIGRNACLNCVSLPEIAIPEGVERIDAEAFSGCSGAAVLTLPQTLTSLGADAFKGCVRLTDFRLPEVFRAHLRDLRVGYGLMLQGGRTIVGSFTYNVLRGAAVLDDYEGPGQELVIPHTIEGQPVGGVSYLLFQNLDGLEKLYLPRYLANASDLAPFGTEVILID